MREAGFDRPPEQTEFARLELDYTVLSKRKLLRLVNEGHVAGWDDPRMPTIAGLRRRGVTPEAIRAFADTIGVARSDARIELATFEHAVRDDLNMRVPRVMAVTRPLKLVLTNYPEGQVETLDAPYYPHDVPKTGSRPVPFSRELWIERDDFMEEPPKKFFRLAPGREVRLRYGYLMTCTEVVKDAAGEVVELRAHLRSRDARRRRTRRPEGAGHDPLGVGGARARLRAAPVRPTVRGARSRCVAGGEGLHGGAQPRFAGHRAGRQDRAERRLPTRRGHATSSSAPATSSAIRRTRSPGALVFNRTVALKDSWAKVKGK